MKKIITLLLFLLSFSAYSYDGYYRHWNGSKGFYDGTLSGVATQACSWMDDENFTWSPTEINGGALTFKCLKNGDGYITPAKQATYTLCPEGQEWVGPNTECQVPPPPPECPVGEKKSFSGTGDSPPDSFCVAQCVYSRGLTVFTSSGWVASAHSTGANCSGGDSGTEGMPAPTAETNYTPSQTTGSNTTDTQNDVPSAGDVTETNTNTETTTPQTTQDVVVTETQVTEVETLGQGVTKTTTTTTVTHSDGSTEVTTVTDYSSTDATVTTRTINENGDTTTQTDVTREGNTGSTTEVITIDSDGNSTTTTTNTGQGAEGAEQEDNDDMGHAPEGKDNMYDHMMGSTGIDALNATMGEDVVPEHNFFNPFEGYGIGTASCQQVPVGPSGQSNTFPGPNGCAALQLLRAILGWSLYLMTFAALFRLAVTVKTGGD